MDLVNADCARDLAQPKGAETIQLRIVPCRPKPGRSAAARRGAAAEFGQQFEENSFEGDQRESIIVVELGEKPPPEALRGKTANRRLPVEFESRPLQRFGMDSRDQIAGARFEHVPQGRSRRKVNDRRGSASDASALDPAN